jgi:hypothetical protein
MKTDRNATNLRDMAHKIISHVGVNFRTRVASDVSCLIGATTNPIHYLVRSKL